MALVKPDLNTFAKIKVLGLGGGGSNAVSSMALNQNIKGVEFVGVNTDAQALLNSQTSIKLQIGEKLTKGLGSGSDPVIGRQAAEESKEKIKELLIDSDMVFITCGMGGGTGTGASTVVAEVAVATAGCSSPPRVSRYPAVPAASTRTTAPAARACRRCLRRRRAARPPLVPRVTGSL